MTTTRIRTRRVSQAILTRMYLKWTHRWALASKPKMGLSSVKTRLSHLTRPSRLQTRISRASINKFSTKCALSLSNNASSNPCHNLTQLVQVIASIGNICSISSKNSSINNIKNSSQWASRLVKRFTTQMHSMRACTRELKFGNIGKICGFRTRSKSNRLKR